MLVLLTGGRQVGKTRMLEDVMERAKDSGIRCVGVYTPGIWRASNDELVKHGINAVLLPQNEEMLFAVGRGESKTCNTDNDSGNSTQSDSAKLGWKIFDQAIDRINDHFDDLVESGINEGDLVIIDELGALEFIHGKGLTSALQLLENGPSDIPASKINVIAIVRPELLDEAKKRLSPTWGEPLAIDASADDAYLGIESLIKSLSSESVKS